MNRVVEQFATGFQVDSSVQSRQKATISIVIPTLNEEKNLPHVLPRIPKWVDEVILVDGLSTDRTVETARKLIPDIKVIMEQTPGKGVALRAGFAAARSDIIVMLDADGSTPPEEIPIFVSQLLNGAEFVKGSRFLQGGGTSDMEFHRKLGNWFFVKLIRLLFGGRYTDLCYGYNAFWRHALPRLELETADGFEIETLLNLHALRAGLKIAEVPSYEYNRIHGNSNLSAFRDGRRILWTILKEWFRGPAVRPAQTPHWNTSSESLRSSIYMLYSEAVALHQNRAAISEQHYQRSVIAVREALDSVLAIEADDAQTRRLQSHYSQIGRNQLWSFLDSDVCFVSKPVGQNERVN